MNMKKNLNRRGFVKTTLLGSIGLGLVGNMTSLHLEKPLLYTENRNYRT